ncbi:MAG: hypothetical protein ACYDC4_06695 [Candidatus Dormibacteria bacterium]
MAFVQLTVAGNSLSGTFDVATLNGTQVQTEHEALSGSESGQSVTLTFAGGLGTTTNVSGGISGDTLVLNIPQSTGQIASATFAPSDVNAYNDALSALQAQAAAQSQAAVQASAAAASQLADWITAHWETPAEMAAVTSASACVLTVGSHDVRVFVAAGGGAVCAAAPQYGWSAVTTYAEHDSVICVGTVDGVTVAVTDSGGAYYGGIACQDIKAGSFPSTPVS